MASTLTFSAPGGSPVISPAASGGFNTLGFYGAGFGLSVRVGEYNETTYRTTANGSSNGSSMPNLRYANTSGAYVAASLTAEELLEIENTEATLRVRLTTDSAVGTQNAKFRAFDRTSINNNPSGVTVYAAEIIKANPSIRGSGDANWTSIYGSGSVLSLDDQATAATTHDFYIGLTCTPTSIGEKTNYAFYFETEFL